jgi:hypothetical protein
LHARRFLIACEADFNYFGEILIDSRRFRIGLNTPLFALEAMKNRFMEIKNRLGAAANRFEAIKIRAARYAA